MRDWGDTLPLGVNAISFFASVPRFYVSQHQVDSTDDRLIELRRPIVVMDMVA